MIKHFKSVWIDFDGDTESQKGKQRFDNSLQVLFQNILLLPSEAFGKGNEGTIYFKFLGKAILSHLSSNVLYISYQIQN